MLLRHGALHRQNTKGHELGQNKIDLTSGIKRESAVTGQETGGPEVVDDRLMQ